jgi:hypothetical protein
MNKYKSKYQSIGGDVNIFKQLATAGVQYSFWAGIGMILFILIWSIFVPCPSNSQLSFFRIVLPLGLTSLATSLPHFFKVNLSSRVKFGAALGVFLVAYFFNPAPVIVKDVCTQDQYVKGQVLYAGIPLMGAEVYLTSMNKMDYTDGNGQFNIAHHQALKEPLNIQLLYKSIDTLISIQTYDNEDIIKIYLEDTIPELSPLIAANLIENYLEKQQKKLEAFHRGLIVKHGGQEVNFKSVCQLFRYHESLCGSERNQTSFENGFIQLSTQKAMIQSGIPIKPLNPYGAYYLNKYKAYLYKLDSIRFRDKQSCTIHFGLLNLNKTTFRIDDLTRLAHDKYLLNVSFKENIRAVRTYVSFDNEQKDAYSKDYQKSKNPDVETSYKKKPGGRKTQTTHYTGTLPREAFVLKYTDGRWYISGTR